MKRLGAPQPEWVEVDSELSILMRPLQMSEIRALMGVIGDEVAAEDPELSLTGAMGALDRTIGAAVDLIADTAQDWTLIDDDDVRLPASRETAQRLFNVEPHLAGMFLAAVVSRFSGRLAGVADEKKG